MILVFGKTGQVARELQKRSPDAIFLGRDQADLTDPAKCAMHILEIKPDAVINAAAYTAVDQAEKEELLATTVNGDAPASMANAAATLDIPFVQISTDYVFDGSGDKPSLPDDLTDPISAYGRSKLAGELGAQAAGGRHAILRTSWVFSAHGSNFVKSMLRLGADRDQLTIVADQIGAPTQAAAIADALLTITKSMIDGHQGGTYHFAGAPDTSWADFAREIFRQADLAAKVIDIPTTDYPTPARRPLNSRLDCESLTRDFAITRADWRAGLSDVLKELKSK
ncbi:MAG: dTDP-4-dehydrorhamnose reductase [Boseongicola sp.]